MFDANQASNAAAASAKLGNQSNIIPSIALGGQDQKNKTKNEFTSQEKSVMQKRKEDLYIEGFTGNDWGDKITFTVGVSYFGAGLVGMTKGIMEGFPKNTKQPTKLLLNNFFNSVGRSSARFGNGCAAASKYACLPCLLYCMVGSTMNFLFEDEVAELSPLQKNVLCGTITGSLYKSTLGIRPTIVGALLGGFLIYNLHNATTYLNQKGLIHFEMKF